MKSGEWALCNGASFTISAWEILHADDIITITCITAKGMSRSFTYEERWIIIGKGKSGEEALCNRNSFAISAGKILHADDIITISCITAKGMNE